MRARPDLLEPASPPGIEVFQLTDESVPSSHVYMEAPIFAPNSQRLVLHRSAHAHGSDKDDPEHRYLLCDVADGTLTPLTSEIGATAPVVSPDGKFFYYVVFAAERVTLRRAGLDGSDRRDVAVIDAAPGEKRLRPSGVYPIASIRSDGRRFAAPVTFRDERSGARLFSLLVFDLETGVAANVLEGPSWCNIHPQYCRSTDPALMRDILVQENHGNEYDAQGRCVKLTGGPGADIHVIRDDGTGFRDMPWGRDGNEFCQGHQCWRGTTAWAITSTVNLDPDESRLIEGLAAPAAGHAGIRTPGGVRNDLSRSIRHPAFSHFGTDTEGSRMISDAARWDEGGRLFRIDLDAPGTGPAKRFTYLFSPRCSCAKNNHIHPFLSPDGRTGFFNSDESGVLQAYMIRGLASVL